MELNVKTIGQVSVVEISGDIDGKTAPQLQEQLMLLLQPACRIILDMQGVGYMSSAGLRLMLTSHRQASGNQGQLILVNVSEEIKETMSDTGFLQFFTLCDTVEAGLEALN